MLACNIRVLEVRMFSLAVFIGWLLQNIISYSGNLWHQLFVFPLSPAPILFYPLKPLWKKSIHHFKNCSNFADAQRYISYFKTPLSLKDISMNTGLQYITEL
jgi:hypothetical protein